jgi:hypothetical protein
MKCGNNDGGSKEMGLGSNVKGGVVNTSRYPKCGVVGINLGMVEQDKNVYRGKRRVGGLLGCSSLGYEVIGYKEEDRSTKLACEVHTMCQCLPNDYRKRVYPLNDK